MSESMIDLVMRALSRERQFDGIHFGGGESALFLDRLLYAMSQIKRAKGRNKWVNNPQPETCPMEEDFCRLVPINIDRSIPCTPTP